MRPDYGEDQEAVEEHEEKDGDDGVDQRGDDEMHGEPGAGLSEKNATGEKHDALMQAKKIMVRAKRAAGCSVSRRAPMEEAR